MALREVLADLDVTVRGAAQVTQVNAGLDRSVHSALGAGSAYETLRVRQMGAAAAAARLASQLLILQRTQGASSAQVEEVQRSHGQATEVARMYGAQADQLRASVVATAASQREMSTATEETAGAGLALGPVLAGLADASAIAQRAFQVTSRVVRAVADEIAAVIEQGADLADTAQRLGVTTRELQELQYVAEQGGVSADTLTGALGRVARGAAAHAPVFHRLGVATRDASGTLRSQSDIALDTLQALRGVTSQTERAALAQQVFGRAGSEMLTMVDETGLSVEQLRARFADLGGGLSDDVVANAAAADDAMVDFRIATTNLRGELAAGLLPSVARGAAGLASFVGWIRQTTGASSRMEVGMGALQVAAGFVAVPLVVVGAAAALALSPFALLYLAVEDVTTAFRGGRSVLGNFVENMHAAMGVTVTFQGSIEAWGVSWDVTVARVRTGVADLLADFEGLQRMTGLEVPGLSDLATRARTQAASARGVAVASVEGFTVHERERRIARVPGLDDATRRSLSTGAARGEGSTTSVHAPITIVTSDPEAAGRAAARHIAAERRTARGHLPLAEPGPDVR